MPLVQIIKIIIIIGSKCWLYRADWIVVLATQPLQIYPRYVEHSFRRSDLKIRSRGNMFHTQYTIIIYCSEYDMPLHYSLYQWKTKFNLLGISQSPTMPQRQIRLGWLESRKSGGHVDGRRECELLISIKWPNMPRMISSSCPKTYWNSIYISNNALFSTWFFSILIPHRRSLHTFY